MPAQFTMEQVRAAEKPRDAWWTVLLVDPVASRLVRLVAGRRGITPNRLTVFAFLLGSASAWCFAMVDYPWLIAGALLYHASFIVDCMDGKVARLTGTGSVFGGWLDYIFDRLRVIGCTIALMGGQYAASHRPIWLVGAGVVIGLDTFRYLNALEIYRVRTEMRDQLAELTGGGAVPAFMEDAEPASTADEDEPDGRVDLHSQFRRRFALFLKVRGWLVRHRIRAHVISGVEFQMFVFIVGPLIGAWAILPLTWITGGILLFFEVAVSYMLYMATTEFERQRTKLIAQGDAAAAGPVQRSGEGGDPGERLPDHQLVDL